MKCTFSIATALLICTAAAMAQYTNVLENGTGQTVTNAWSTNAVWVGATTPGNALYIVSGGVVTSTNGYVGVNIGASNNLVSVTGTGSWTIEGTLKIGIGTSNVVSVGDGGTIDVGDLILNPGNAFNLDSGGTFAIGTNFNASTDGFNWNDGGKLSVDGELTGMAISNNAYYLDGGRDLTLDGGTWDTGGTNLVVGYGSSGSILVVNNTGTLSSATTYIGWDTNSANNVVTVSDGAIWNNSGDLWVGNGGSDNSISILSGGSVTVDGSAYIGNTNTTDNQVFIAGTGTVWNVAVDLMIGNGSNSVDNLLEISDSAEVLVAGDLTLNSGNSLLLYSGGLLEAGSMNVYSNSTIDGTGAILFGTNDAVLAFYGNNIALSTGIVFTANSNFNNLVSVNNGTFTVAGTNALPYEYFQTLELNGSTLAGYGTFNIFDSVDMTGGMIDPQGASSDTAQLVIANDFSASGTIYSAQVYDTRWDELVFTGPGVVDLSGMEADVLVVSAPTGAVTILSATNNLTGTFYKTNLVDRLLLYNAVLEITSTNVQVSLEADPLESSMEFAATEMIRAGFGGMQNAVFARTKQLRRNLAATANAIPNEVYQLTNTNAPAGAMGPGDQNTIFDMHVWLQQYSGQGDFDRQNESDGFTLNNEGTSIGVDRLVGEALTLGFNYTYARSSARTTGSDDLDSETYWLGTYGEWVGKEGLYVDALAAVGFSNYDTTRREENYEGTASYDGQAFGAYVDVGQYYQQGQLVLSPYAGIHVLNIVVDGHNETDELGSSVNVDEVTRNLVESAFGLKMRHRFDTRIGRFQTTGYAEWAHDFIDDDVSVTMKVKGFPSVSTGGISPDADTINVGLGYSWICTDYMEIGIGYSGRFSENYEENTGSLMLDIMF